MLKRLYQRTFLERIQAIVTRLDTVIGEVTSLRGELREVRAEIQEVQRRQEALERQVETVIAGGWDTTALSRRLARLEDRAEGR